MAEPPILTLTDIGLTFAGPGFVRGKFSYRQTSPSIARWSHLLD